MCVYVYVCVCVFGVGRGEQIRQCVMNMSEMEMREGEQAKS